MPLVYYLSILIILVLAVIINYYFGLITTLLFLLSIAVLFWLITPQGESKPNKIKPHQNVKQPSNKTCPYCFEQVKAEAVKCKHCHELIKNNFGGE